MDQANASDQDSHKEIIQNILVTAGGEFPVDLQNTYIKVQSLENYVRLRTSQTEKQNTKCPTNTYFACRKFVEEVAKNNNPTHASGKSPCGVWNREMGESVTIDTVRNPSVPTNLASLQNCHILAAFEEQTNIQKEAQAKQDNEKVEPKHSGYHQD